MLRIIITKIKKFLEKMAKISNYSKDTSISGQDKVIGSDANSKFATKNYTIDDIASYTINQIDQVTPGNSITGRVSWSGEGLVFQSTLITGSLNGVTINIPQNLNIVLNPADPTNDRFDLFVVNTNNTLTVLQGTPSANPVKPSIDQLTQFEIGFVRVSAGQATPSELSNVTVYNEDLGQPTEWNFSTSLPAQIIPGSTANPQSGEKSIYFKDLPMEGLVTFQAASAINASDIQSVTFKIKKNSVSGAVGISFYLGNDTDNVGDAVLIFDGQFGFDGSNTSSYQNIVIDREDFNLPTVADITKMGFLVRQGFDGYIDNIKVNQSTNIEIPQTPLEWATYTGTRLAGDLDLIIGDYDNYFAGTRMQLKQATGEIYLGLENRYNGILYEATENHKITLGALPNVGQLGGLRVEIGGDFQEFKVFNESESSRGFQYDTFQGFLVKDDVRFSEYGSGTKTGTATYSLNVDANGNVIEGPVGGTSNASLQTVLTAGNTWTDGLQTYEFNLVGGSGTLSYTNPDEPWGWSIDAEEGFTLTDGVGSSVGRSGIDINSVFVGNGSHKGSIRSANITGNRTLQMPDASGTIALTSDLSGYVDLTSNQSIDGDKTFEGIVTLESSIVMQDSTMIAGSGGYTLTFPTSNGTLALTSDLSSLSADQEIADFNATIDQVGVMVDVNSATDVVVTVRDFATEAIPVGSVLTYRQAGVGKISNAYSVATGDTSTTYREGDVLTLWQKTQDNWVVINPPHAIDSQTAGEPTGSDQVLNVVSLTQAEYDAAVGSHNADTLYVITS